METCIVGLEVVICEAFPTALPALEEFFVALVAFVGFFQVQSGQYVMDFLVQFGNGPVICRRIFALGWFRFGYDNGGPSWRAVEQRLGGFN